MQTIKIPLNCTETHCSECEGLGILQGTSSTETGHCCFFLQDVVKDGDNYLRADNCLKNDVTHRKQFIVKDLMF